LNFWGIKKNIIAKKSTSSQLSYNLHDLQSLSIDQLVAVISAWKQSSGHNQTLVDRICTPLLDRASTISSLGLGYLQTTRAVDTLSGGGNSETETGETTW
jgi:excinuclease UvrABC ATPase subunit